MSFPGKHNILVTGAAGFIGSHLCDALLSAGHNVTGMDNFANGKKENLQDAYKNSSFKFIEGNILKDSDVLKATEGIEVVYHLACMGVRHSLHSPLENHRVNAEGTLTLLQACVKNKAKKFFYISTSEVYGDIKTFPIKETDTPFPKTVYGASKLAGEHYASSFQVLHGLDVTILRIFNNYGPRAHYEGDAGEIIPRSIVKLLYGEAPVIFGDGSITRDFFFVKDTARVLTDLLKAQNISGETINIGTGEEITMRSLLEKLVTLSGSTNSLQYKEARPADVPRLWVDTSKFKKILSFQSSVTLERGLKETIDYYRLLAKEKNLLKEIKEINWKK